MGPQVRLQRIQRREDSILSTFFAFYERELTAFSGHSDSKGDCRSSWWHFHWLSDIFRLLCTSKVHSWQEHYERLFSKKAKVIEFLRSTGSTHTKATKLYEALPFCPSPLKGGRGKMAKLCFRFLLFLSFSILDVTGLGLTGWRNKLAFLPVRSFIRRLAMDTSIRQGPPRFLVRNQLQDVKGKTCLKLHFEVLQ